jgi:hypothetical protein
VQTSEDEVDGQAGQLDEPDGKDDFGADLRAAAAAKRD